MVVAALFVAQQSREIVFGRSVQIVTSGVNVPGNLASAAVEVVFRPRDNKVAVFSHGNGSVLNVVFFSRINASVNAGFIKQRQLDSLFRIDDITAALLVINSVFDLIVNVFDAFVVLGNPDGNRIAVVIDANSVGRPAEIGIAFQRLLKVVLVCAFAGKRTFCIVCGNVKREVRVAAIGVFAIAVETIALDVFQSFIGNDFVRTIDQRRIQHNNGFPLVGTEFRQRSAVFIQNVLRHVHAVVNISNNALQRRAVFGQLPVFRIDNAVVPIRAFRIAELGSVIVVHHLFIEVDNDVIDAFPVDFCILLDALAVNVNSGNLWTSGVRRLGKSAHENVGVGIAVERAVGVLVRHRTAIVQFMLQIANLERAFRRNVDCSVRLRSSQVAIVVHGNAKSGAVNSSTVLNGSESTASQPWIAGRIVTALICQRRQDKRAIKLHRNIFANVSGKSNANLVFSNAPNRFAVVVSRRADQININRVVTQIDQVALQPVNRRHDAVFVGAVKRKQLARVLEGVRFAVDLNSVVQRSFFVWIERQSLNFRVANCRIFPRHGQFQIVDAALEDNLKNDRQTVNSFLAFIVIKIFIIDEVQNVVKRQVFKTGNASLE